MDNVNALDAIPLSAFFVLTLLIVLFAIEGGYRLGRFRLTRTEHEKEAPVAAMVAAMLGLLAFILAFTFSLAAQRFDARRQVLLDEANAIGTTYLRAAMLPQHEEEIRSLLRDYVDIRLAAERITAGIRNRVPDVIWVALFAVAVIALGAMGYHAGLVRTSRSLAIVAVGVTFTV